MFAQLFTYPGHVYYSYLPLSRTVRWLDRCLKAHEQGSVEESLASASKRLKVRGKGPKHQNLFAIVQGGLDVSPGGLRDQCLDAFLERQELIPGFAIGGLAGGESKDAFWRVVKKCCDRLPPHKPRYLMGVGYPLDLVVCTALGVDMYDCVFPTRTARFGTALVDRGDLKLRNAKYKLDENPIDKTCGCSVCNYGRAPFVSRRLLRHYSKNAGVQGGSLISTHNVFYMLDLSKRMREAILQGRYADFVRVFLRGRFGEGEVPGWVVDALGSVDIKL